MRAQVIQRVLFDREGDVCRTVQRFFAIAVGTATLAAFALCGSDWTDKFPRDSKKRLRKLFAKAQGCAESLPIRFTHENSSARYTSHLAIRDAEIMIGIRDNLSLAVEENAIAHELYHIVLAKCEGYSNKINVPNHPIGVSAAILEDLGATITSCVDDRVVDDRLKKLGFSPEVLNHVTVSELAQQGAAMTEAVLADRAFLAANGLALYCYSLRRAYTADKMETLGQWKRISPAVVEFAHHLESRLGSPDCSDAPSCFEMKKRIRDVMGYSQIRLHNPVTNRNE
jgi:hypothetical protein